MKTWKELHEARLVRLRVEPDLTAETFGHEVRIVEYRMLPGHAWTLADSINDCFPGLTTYDEDMQNRAVELYHSSLEAIRTSRET